MNEVLNGVESPSAALYYEPEGFDTTNPQLMGRHVAGEGFLVAMARHAAAGDLTAVARTRQDFDDFAARVDAASDGKRSTAWISTDRLAGLSNVGCLLFPGSVDPRWAWIRRRNAQRDYSLCGVTHTTATELLMHKLGELLVAPVQSWDALVCTSGAVQAMVKTLMQGYAEYLGQRFGTTHLTWPQLPLIPLGVDCDALTPDKAAKARGRALRQRSGIAADALVVLFVGRLSFHSKAHPLPIYLALQQAAQTCERPIHLVFAGWFGNETIEQQFRDAAKAVCPTIDVTFLDGRGPDVRSSIWHAADIFTSPSDNIQETFGLTPLEAMAAGLPGVLSDWNGYRDTIRHGEEGFLVPTWWPPEAAGEELAHRYLTGLDSYNRYVGHASQFAAVEISAMTQAFTALLGNPALRLEMGRKARRRALAHYAWPVIISQYEALWTELAARRSGDRESAPAARDAPVVPLNDNPYRLFASYPSQTLSPDTQVALLPEASPRDLAQLMALDMNSFAKALMPDAVVLGKTLTRLQAEGPASLQALAEEFSSNEHLQSYQRGLVWLAKIGLVHLRSP